MAKYDNICVLDNGYIGVEQTADGEKLYGIIDLEGNVIMKPTHKVQGLSDYNDGMYIFYDGEALGIRNINNEVVIRAKYDGIVWATEDMFWGNTAVDGRQGWSLVDLDGNKITKDTYLEALPFYDGENAFVQITDNTWGMINKKGEELKNVPDIYTVEDNTADDVIVSDFFDIDAIVSAVNMTPSGFGGFAIYMRPLEILKVYNENCDDGAKIELNPKDAHVDKLSYKKQILKGIEMKAELYYSEYMTEIGESYYDNTVDEWIQHPAVWTNDQPQYIKVTVSGPKLEGKTDMLYKKLLVKVKSYGKVYKENDHACIVLRKNNTGIVLVNTGSEVWAMVKSKDLASSEYIEKYSEERTYRDPAFD